MWKHRSELRDFGLRTRAAARWISFVTSYCRRQGSTVALLRCIGGHGHLIKTNINWRGSWYSILAGKFSDSQYDDLVFYDKSAATAQFFHCNGNGTISSAFATYNDWRTTWRGVVAGNYSLNYKYSGLLFYEDNTGYTEFYHTDGKGGIHLVSVGLNSSTWSSRSARWQTVLAAQGFTGTTETAGISSMVGYDPTDGAVDYFYIKVSS